MQEYMQGMSVKFDMMPPCDLVPIGAKTSADTALIE